MSITSVFANGGSQAVRIPKEFRFSTSRVSIEACDGGILLRPLEDKPSLQDFFAACDELSIEEKSFLSDYRRGQSVQRSEIFQ